MLVDKTKFRLGCTSILAAFVISMSISCSSPESVAAPEAIMPTTTSPRVTEPVIEKPRVYPALAPSVPTSVIIPSIGIDSTLMDLGLNADNTMEVPPEGFPAGWFTGAPTPGELGPAVIAGHVDWVGPAVFHDLKNIAVGAEIIVHRQDSSVVTFEVVSVEQFAKNEFPTDRVYSNIDYAGLRVITCGGEFDENSGHYLDNVVVFAKMKT
jgi:LPXTG-site transpeptidase (sortase) family protein